MATSPQEKPEPLEIAVDKRGVGVVMRLSGSATMDCVDQLRERLLTLAAERRSPLVVDLTNLRFINSLGLGILITAHVRCQRRGQQMRIVNPTPAIEEMLKLTKLSDLFRVYSSVEAAIAQA